MAALIRADSETSGREPPTLPGLEQIDTEWVLRVDNYEQFIEEVTGVEVTAELTPQQMKTIQSRIEGCVEGYRRSGDCVCDEFARYEHINSIEAVHELSRFFRVLVASHVEGETPTEL